MTDHHDDDVIRRAVHELVHAAPAPKKIQDRGPQGTRRWLAATAAGFIGVAGLVVVLWALTGESSLVTSDTTPPTELDTLPPPDTAPSPSVGEPESATTQPTTTVAVTSTTTRPQVPMLPVGSFDLTRDDVIARSVDGDVYLYPAALGGTPGEPVLLIDRDDPRPVPAEGTSPNYIDHVAGTYDGMLIYGDCCEPVSGNVYAIAEPGAESDLFTSTGIGDRARSLPHGFDPVLDPDGTRVVTSNWALVNVIDLATGTTTYASPGQGSEESINMTGEPFDALTATWTSTGMVVVVGRTGDGQIIVTEHSPDDLRTEVRRVVVEPTVQAPEDWIDVDVIELTDDLISVVRYDADGLHVVDVDATTFQLVDVDRDFPPPANAAVVRHSIERNAWAWIVDDVAYLHTPDGGTVEWQRDIADVWFPTIIDTRRPATGSSPSTPTTTNVSTTPTPAATFNPADRLASWPAAPAGPLPANDIPRLLATVSITPAGTPVRGEWDIGAVVPTVFTQVFADADRDILVTLYTHPNGTDSTPVEMRQPLTIKGWDDAFGTDGVLRLVASGPSGYVGLYGTGIEQDEAVAILASMQRRPDGISGWDLAPEFDGLEEINGAWNDSAGGQFVTWFDGDRVVAQMLTSPGHTDLIHQALGAEFERVDVNGTDGWLNSNDSRSSIVWSPDGTTIAVLGVVDDRIDPLAVARSVTGLDAADYEARTTTEVPAGVGDGCDGGLFC